MFQVFKKLALACGPAPLVSANSFGPGAGGKDLKISTGWSLCIGGNLQSLPTKPNSS